MNIPKQYKIVETHCFPCKYKIVAIGFRDNNDTCNYKRTMEECMIVIEKAGGELVAIEGL